MEKRVLGKDYVLLSGRGGREDQNGATVKSDDKIHLSVDMGKTTICGSAVDKFMLTYSDVEIDCPQCIKRLKAKSRGTR